MPIQPITGQIKAQPLNDNFSFLESKISNIGNASPKGTYDTLADLKNAYPNGTTGIYVVLADGNWYYWNGTAWTSGGVYQSTGLAKRSVSFQNLDIPVVKRTYSLDANKKVNSQSLFDTPQENLFNKNTVTMGFYLINGVPTSSPGNGYSDYIPVTAGSSYWITRILTTDGGEFCDDNFNFVQKIVGDGTNILTIPTNVSNIRLNISPSNSPLETFMVVEGTTAPETYRDAHIGKINGLHVESDHIDGSILLEQFEEIEALNLFDPSARNPDTYVSNTGVVASSTTIDLSRYIKVSEGDVIGCNFKYDIQGEFCTSEKNWMKPIVLTETNTGSGWFVEVVPAGAEFIRVNVVKNDLNKFIIRKSNLKPLRYFPYSGISKSFSYIKWRGKKAAFVGDSITEVNFRTKYNYHAYVAEINGMIVLNYGLSGTGYAEPYNSSPAIKDRINTIDSTSDLIVVFAGTNDFGNGDLPLGNLTDTDGTVSVTGAIYSTYSQLVNRFPTKKIAIMTPLPRSDGNSFNPVVKAGGFTLEQLVNRIKEMAAMFSFPCLDLYHESNLPVWNATANSYYFTAPGQQSPDGLHPNDEGHKVIADKVVNWLESL